MFSVTQTTKTMRTYARSWGYTGDLSQQIFKTSSESFYLSCLPCFLPTWKHQVFLDDPTIWTKIHFGLGGVEHWLCVQRTGSKQLQKPGWLKRYQRSTWAVQLHRFFSPSPNVCAWTQRFHQSADPDSSQKPWCQTSITYWRVTSVAFCPSVCMALRASQRSMQARYTTLWAVFLNYWTAITDLQPETPLLPLPQVVLFCFFSSVRTFTFCTGPVGSLRHTDDFGFWTHGDDSFIFLSPGKTETQDARDGQAAKERKKRKTERQWERE